MRRRLENKAKKVRDDLRMLEPFIVDLDFFEMLYTKRLKKYFTKFFNYALQ
jgi:hypothetical protein